MSWLYTIPLCVVALLVLLLVVVALETGHRLSKIAPVVGEQVSTVATPILAIVGFLLAFAFGMAGDRHAARRSAAVQEANAIGTFWLRTTLIEEPVRSEMRSRLRRYVDIHIEHRAARIDRARMSTLELEADRIQQEMWQLLDAEADRGLGGTRLRLLMPALNAVIDDGAVVLAAKENRVPDAVLVYVFGLIVVAGVVIGYRPRGERRNYVLWGLYLVVLGGALVIMLDMDRPRRGLIQADTSILLRLQQSLVEDAEHG